MTRRERSPRRALSLASALVPVVAIVVACASGDSSSPAPSAIVASEIHESIRVTLTLEGPPRTGAASWASVRIENEGDRGIRWAAGGCGDPGDIFIDLREVFPMGRSDWPEPSERFKELALGPGNTNGLLTMGYVAEARWGTSLLCAASLRIETLQPDEGLSMRAGWDGTYEGLPVPIGPATVEATFPVVGMAGVVTDTEIESHPVGVSLRTEIVGVGGATVLAPALAIDAALADPEFAAWVSAGPVARWMNPDVARIGTTWQIGLFKSGANGVVEAYHGVVVDTSGHVTDHKSG